MNNSIAKNVPKNKYRKTLVACYFSFITQAICANFITLLFVFFYDNYGITLSELALIPTVFFFVQLIVDFFCAKFADRLGYRPCIIVSEILSGLGLVSLALLPDLFTNKFIGIIISVIIYAIGSGLTEVIASPIIEACPFENKETTMSFLHSFYCWGTLGVILLSTIFFMVFGIENWKILTLLWAIIPLYNVYNFATCPMERLLDGEEGMKMSELLKSKYFWLFIVLMICAGASEISMSQWASAFVETGLNVSKTIGDLVGPSGFMVCMGISRLLYGKFGEKIDLSKFMIISGVLALIAYLVSGLSNIPILSLIGCALCGFSVGIMWPGSISVSSKKMPKGGTALFAFLALAGDFGGSIGPMAVGSVSEALGNNLKLGILMGSIFPIGLVICLLFIRRTYKINK